MPIFFPYEIKYLGELSKINFPKSNPNNIRILMKVEGKPFGEIEDYFRGHAKYTTSNYICK